MSSTDPDLVRFIRGVLGCACPDELLRAIRTDRPRLVAGIDAALVRIDVGGRLLVWVVAVDERRNALAKLVATAVTAGSAERDRLSFNRLRLVLATATPSEIGRSARQAFDACHRPDDRIHLHVVDLRAVPLSVRPPEVHPHC